MYHHQKKVKRPNVFVWRAFALALLATNIMTLFMMFTLVDTKTTQPLRDYIYQVCNESRVDPHITEHYCGELQDATGTQFVCDKPNTDPANHCWVEEL